MRLGSWQCLCSTLLYTCMTYDTGGITTPLNLNRTSIAAAQFFEKENFCLLYYRVCVRVCTCSTCTNCTRVYSTSTLLLCYTY